MFLVFILFGSELSYLGNHDTRPPPRRDTSRSRSPLHGPAPYNPRLSLGSIESSEFFTRWRPVLVMAQFHDLAFVGEGRQLGGLMHACCEDVIPTLHRNEEQAIYLYIHQVLGHSSTQLIPFSGMATEILLQVEQTWGVIISPEDIKLTIPHPEHHHTSLPDDMTVREALDRFRPQWHREQDFGFEFRQPFNAPDQPYVFRIDCKSNAPDIRVWEPHDGDP